MSRNIASTSRRHWLKQGLALSGASLLPGAHLLAAPQPIPGRMILLFLRGGLDGLFAIAPTADSRLASLRPTLSRQVLESGIALGGSGFSAHPGARELADLFAARELSFAPSAGTTDTSRSHFQAQDLFELGSGQTQGGSGLLARAQNALGTRQPSLIAFTGNQPLILQGSDIPPEIAPLTGSGLKMRQDKALDAIRAMHDKQKSGAAIEQAMSTQAEIDTLQGMDPKAARGAAGLNGFPRMAATVAGMLAANPKLSLAFIELGGFDTHAGEENALARALPLLGQGMVALRDGLGAAEWRRTQMLVCTEFGRTVRENGTQDTDHGHGSLALLAGGNINGGRMLGGFDGLTDSALNEKRDLPVRLDWRSLIGKALMDTQGFDLRTAQNILPGMPGRY